MGKSNAQKAWERLTLTHEMLCDKEFSTIRCKKCDYYYVVTYDSCNVASCLKNNIKDWTLYRISEG